MKIPFFCATSAAAVCSYALFPALSFAAEASSPAEALSSGTIKLHLRTRIENVEQDNPAEDATATTLKTRLTYTSANYRGFGLTLEMDDTTELVDQDYTDGVTPRGTSPIADPEVTEVNQAFVSYTSDAIQIKYGRQRILLDNQRFVGGVGWRQDEQTYDAFSVKSTPTEDSTIFAAYITDVNRIFAEADDHNHQSILLNASYQTPFGKAIAYGYLLDNQSVAGLSSDTYGLRWEGRVNEWLGYTLEYATQSDGGDNPQEYSADYVLAETAFTLPIKGSQLTVKPGYEKLASDNGTSFKTPLATLHAFQGWTDGFLVTPDDGVIDAYLTTRLGLAGYQVGLGYHSFTSDIGDQDYGSEFNLVVTKRFGLADLTFKYADYSADDYWVDTSKIWLMAAMTF